MPPVRTTASIKPMKTERSHEENQERAYIAASRRSDRSLEARVESARRASEIHEKRTGRRLRVTEQDVINEEMYEEEDDNISRRYRQLGLFPNLAALNPEFRRRVEAQIVVDMERSNMVQQNSSLGMFGNQFAQYGNAAQAQYMNPWMMQMPHAGQQSPLLPASIYSFGQPNPGLAPPMHQFGHTSPGGMYPPSPSAQHQTHNSVSGDQQTQDRPNYHQRSASIAAPQHISAVRQQASPVVHESVKAQRLEERRSSLPPNVTAHPTKSPKNATSPASAHTPSSQHSHNSQPHISRHHTYTGPINTSPKSTQSTSSHPYGPLTPTLPMNTQQILGAGMPFGTGEQSYQFSNPSMYNYNPNGTLKNDKKRNHDQMAASTGLEQTLMPTALDTSINNNSALYDSPASSNTDAFSAAMTEPGYGMGFNHDDFVFDPFNASNSSGHGSPEEFSSFLNGDIFTDQQAF